MTAHELQHFVTAQNKTMIISAWNNARLQRAKKIPSFKEITKSFEPKISRDTELQGNQSKLFAALMNRSKQTEAQEEADG